MGRTLRTLTIVTGLVATGAVGCTIQETPAPALMGPSGMSLSLSIQADRPILERGNLTAVRISARNHQSQPMSVAVRLELLAQGSLFDYGRLSAREVTTGSDGNATVTYFAPAPAAFPSDSGEDIVTILVTPLIGGDNRGVLARQLDIRLIPQGVIALPLFPSFTVTPAAPTVGQAVVLDASASTRGGQPCLDNCGYTWTFGDGTSAMGRVVHKTYSAPGSYTVHLRVSDEDRLAVDSAPRIITVAPLAAPTAALTVSPSGNNPVGTVLQFNGSGSAATFPATIVQYRFNFGQAGVEEQVGSSPLASHTFTVPGTYVVRLTVTDSQGRTGTTTLNVTATP